MSSFYACLFSTVEQLGSAQCRSDVARRPQDLLPDVEMSAQLGDVVCRGRHG